MRTLLLLCLIPFLGCSQNAVPVFTDVDSTIKVVAGKSFAVQLPSNIATGYRWELKTQPDPALLVLTKQEHQPGESPDDNAGGRDYFLFETRKKGETQLIFWFVRPWKKDKEADPNTREKTFNVAIQ